METLETTYEAATALSAQQRKDLAAMLQVASAGEPLSYDDARTMLGYQQALKGEGLSRAEVNAHMEKVFAEIENGQ